MVDPELISLWKQEYGQIYVVSERGVDYVFREITFAEYDSVALVEASSSTADAEDKVVSIALLHPDIDNLDHASAGLVTVLAEEILEVSGFGSPQVAKAKLDEKREEAAQVRGLMKAFVLATMPAYKEEELDNFTFGQLIEKVALAEQIIKVNQAAFGVENDLYFALIDPEEEAAKQQAEEERKRRDRERAERLLRERGGLHADQDESPPIKPNLRPDDPILQKLHSALKE